MFFTSIGILAFKTCQTLSLPPVVGEFPVAGILSIFQRLLPASFIEQACAQARIRCHNRVYNPLVVLWLFVVQRLHGGAPLEAAVLELVHGLPASFWPQPCKRVRDWKQDGKSPSSNTGAYNQARQALPVSVVRESCDRIFESLVTEWEQPSSGLTGRAFLLDGSSVRLAHTRKLCERYPPATNQNGEGHWPLLRILVAHDLHTGLAMRPVWGPMYGPAAVSEQALLEQSLGGLPGGATIIGDRNFGVFSVAYAAMQSQHPFLLRLTTQRAQRLSKEPLRDGIDCPVIWRPSRDDRKNHPELPAEAYVSGRLVVLEVRSGNDKAPFFLALFTSLQVPQAELLALYGQRWNIETDLRTLKSTLRLDEITCATPDMVEKEIDLGITTYNLVRAAICLASKQSGIPPRGYGFTRVRRIVQAFAPLIAAASTAAEAQKLFDQMMRYIQQAKLPRRSRERPSYPRAAWNRRSGLPKRQA